MVPVMLWSALAILSLCHGQLTTEDEIQMLSEDDQQLMKQFQETRQFINGQLVGAIEVLWEKEEENRHQIRNLAEMTQKILRQIVQKVNQQSNELGQAEDLAEVELPLLGAAVAEGEANQANKIQQLAHLTKVMQMQQQIDVKMEQMLNRSRQRAKEEIGQLKGKISEINQTNQQLQKKLLAALSSESSVGKEVQAIQQEANSHDEDKKIESLHSIFDQFASDINTKMHQLEDAQLQKSQSNQARMNSLDGRMSQLRLSLAAEMHSRDKWIFIQELLFCIFVGITVTAADRVLKPPVITASLPQFRPSLQQPLLVTDTPISEQSFSLVSASIAPQPQLFLKRTAVSLQDGPPVAAEDLRPNCLVHAALGGWLEVEAVTFKHVQQCDVIELTLAGDAPSFCIPARQRVVRSSKQNEVIPAMELREADWMMYHGSCLEVKKVDRQTLHNVELVEVLFDTEGAVETLADADAEQSAFHMV